MMYESVSSNPLVQDFRSTSTMTLSGSSLASPVYAVGTGTPQYVGTFLGPQRAPGTGGFNPNDYGEHGGTGFPAPVGGGMGVLLALIFVYCCIKNRSRLAQK